MRRNRCFSRRIWYIKKRNLHRIGLCTRLFPVMLSAVLVLICINSLLAPVLKEEAGLRVKDRMESVIKEAAQDLLTENGYADNTGDGTIRLLTDSMEESIGEITSQSISESISERLRAPERVDIGVPLGSFTGTGMLYGRGPLVKANINAFLNSGITCSFEALPDNGKNAATRTILRITALISYHGLLINGTEEVICTLPVYFPE